jgi:hypothetical protein
VKLHQRTSTMQHSEAALLAEQDERGRLTPAGLITWHTKDMLLTAEECNRQQTLIISMVLPLLGFHGKTSACLQLLVITPHLNCEQKGSRVRIYTTQLM